MKSNSNRLKRNSGCIMHAVIAANIFDYAGVLFKFIGTGVSPEIFKYDA